MSRSRAPLFAGLVLIASAVPALAADGPAGTWRASFLVDTENGETRLNMLMMFSEQDGKWAADFLDANPRFTKDDPTLELTVKDDTIKLGIKIGNATLTLDGKVQPGGKSIKGSLDLGGQMVLVDMVPSKLKSLTKDRFAVAREDLETAEAPADFFKALYPVIGQAAAKKLKPEEVRALADKASKLAEPFGTRWQRTVAFKLADLLADQEPFAAIAVEQARQGERLLTRTDDISTQLQTLDTLARVLRKAKKDDEAKEVEGRVAKLEPRDYAEYSKTMPPFKADEYKGRTGKSNRAVLVELFTGSECGPCVAVDLAFDSLGRTYKPSDVILLQYHAHIPAPDPLVSKDGEARMDFYNKKDDEKSTPQIYLNGQPDKTGGGGAPRMAKLKYTAYREAIDELLEKPATVKLTATVTLRERVDHQGQRRRPAKAGREGLAAIRPRRGTRPLPGRQRHSLSPLGGAGDARRTEGIPAAESVRRADGYGQARRSPGNEQQGARRFPGRNQETRSRLQLLQPADGPQEPEGRRVRAERRDQRSAPGRAG